MITLIHGTDLYLSQKELQIKKDELLNKGIDIKVVNVDDDNEVSDPTVIYAHLTDTDLFGSKKGLILKRITSSPFFFKLGKPLKVADKLFETIKNSAHEIILWEDKMLTIANPLIKLAQEKKAFKAPEKDYEVSSYIAMNFKDIDNDIRKVISTNIKTTDTYEIFTEIEKLKSTPKDLLNSNNLVISSNTPPWAITDFLIYYLNFPTDQNLAKFFKELEKIEDDIRYKLTIIQNNLSEIFYVKMSKKKPELKEFFKGNRSWLIGKIEKSTQNVSLQMIFDLYEKSLIIEYLLNKGLIIEEVALQYIFLESKDILIREMLLE